MESIEVNAKQLTYIRSAEAFDKAYRKAFLQDIIQRISGHHLDLLSFNDVVAKLHLCDTVNLGLQDIPVKAIIGSSGRYADFNRAFLPRRAGLDKERWRQIYTRAVVGEGFPPINVYKIDQAYFVEDGNHRVSVARKLEWTTIQAYVTEFPTVFTLNSDIRSDHLLIKEECALFLEQTQLHLLRPEADIIFTVPGRYRRLLDQISVHCYFLAKQTQAEFSYETVMLDWYDTFYRPLIMHLQKIGIMKLFPHRTPDDLAAWLVEHQQSLRLDHDIDEVGHTEDIAKFLAHINQLTAWDIAKAEIKDRTRQWFHKLNS